MTTDIKTLVIPTHLKMIEVGWGNGYVGVPQGHPWFGKDYDSITCEVHGGLTYAANHAPTNQPDGLWWVGFDTAHFGDTTANRSREFVEAETERLRQQAAAVAMAEGGAK